MCSAADRPASPPPMIATSARRAVAAGNMAAGAARPQPVRLLDNGDRGSVRAGKDASVSPVTSALHAETPPRSSSPPGGGAAHAPDAGIDRVVMEGKSPSPDPGHCATATVESVRRPGCAARTHSSQTGSPAPVAPQARKRRRRPRPVRTARRCGGTGGCETGSAPRHQQQVVEQANTRAVKDRDDQQK